MALPAQTPDTFLELAKRLDLCGSSLLDGGAVAFHFQQFVSLTANIGRFSKELTDLQDSMRSVRSLLAIPSEITYITV